MIEILTNMPGKIVGIRASGTVTADHLMRGMVHAFQFAMPQFLRVLSIGEQDAAIEWLKV
jgi:hypothetical protein